MNPPSEFEDDEPVYAQDQADDEVSLEELEQVETTTVYNPEVEGKEDPQ